MLPCQSPSLGRSAKSCAASAANPWRASAARPNCAGQPHRGNAPAGDLGKLGEERLQVGFDFRQPLLFL